MTNSEQKVIEIIKELGFKSVDEVEEFAKFSKERQKEIKLRANVKFMNVCYTIGDGHYREGVARGVGDDEKHESQMRHLYGRRAVLSNMLVQVIMDKEWIKIYKKDIEAVNMDNG